MPEPQPGLPWLGPLLRALLILLLLAGFGGTLIQHLLAEAQTTYGPQPDWTKTPPLRVQLANPHTHREVHDKIDLTARQALLVISPVLPERQLELEPGNKVVFLGAGSEGIIVRHRDQSEIWPVRSIAVVPQRRTPDLEQSIWLHDPGRAEAADRRASFELRFGTRRRSYRGCLTILPAGAQVLQAINELPMEAYVEGLLQGEMSGGWPEQALKAQAIAGRSYAYASLWSPADEHFDIRDGGDDPTYRGTGHGSLTIDAAVLETHGQVLTFQGDPFLAHFHAASGGHTAGISAIHADAGTVSKGLPLTGVMVAKPDPWYEPGLVASGTLATHGERIVDIVPFHLRKRLEEAGYENIWPNRLEATFNPSGRLANMTIMVMQNLHMRIQDDLQMSGHDFRQLIGLESLRSTLWAGPPEPLVTNATDVKAGYRITTYGWGHGVGLSQVSAYAMAEADWQHRAIVHFFYPGAEIQRHY